MIQKDAFFNVVLLEPEIPQNTGNIGRTCVATNSVLHLIEPFGFEISDKTLKRAGLDYWQYLEWHTYANWKDFLKTVHQPERIFYFTTKAKKHYTDFKFQKNDCFVFGKETKGIDPEILKANPETQCKIPILGPARSLNLATSVSIALYEGIRQLG